MFVFRYETNTEEFLKLVQECVRNSKIRIYDKKANEDPHYMLFDKYNAQIHDTYTEMLLKEKTHSVCNFRFSHEVRPTCTANFVDLYCYRNPTNANRLHGYYLAA